MGRGEIKVFFALSLSSWEIRFNRNFVLFDTQSNCSGADPVFRVLNLIQVDFETNGKLINNISMRNVQSDIFVRCRRDEVSIKWYHALIS